MVHFTDQVVFITGASSGIGEALAREFAREGAKLVLAARRLDRLESLAASLRERGASALAVACDVTRDGDLEAALARAHEVFGPIDVVVANAGFGVVGRFQKLSLEDFRRQFETNVFGLLRTVQATLPDLLVTRGRLALLGSVSGHISAPEASPYSMSKFAVRALAEALYAELAPGGVSVTLISPGFVATEIRHLDKSGQYRETVKDPIPAWLQMPAEKAARQIVRAIARGKRERVITLHGKALVAINGLIPGLIPRLFRWMARRVRRGR